MAINHLHSSSDATSLYVTVMSGTSINPTVWLQFNSELTILWFLR
jgi:hypothetical protein